MSVQPQSIFRKEAVDNRNSAVRPASVLEVAPLWAKTIFWVPTCFISIAVLIGVFARINVTQTWRGTLDSAPAPHQAKPFYTFKILVPEDDLPFFSVGSTGSIRLDRAPHLTIIGRVTDISRTVASKDEIGVTFSNYIHAPSPSVIVKLQVDAPGQTDIPCDRAFGTATFVTHRVRPIQFVLRRKS